MISRIQEPVVELRSKVAAILVAIITGLNSGCLGSHESISQGTTPSPTALTSPANIPDQSEAAAKAVAIERVTKTAGWLRVKLEDNRVKLSRRVVNTDDDIFVSSVVPLDSAVLSLRCDSRDLEPQIKERCSEFPFESDYAISEITINDFRGRSFCYGVTAERLNNGSRGGFHFFKFSDEDGDGTFESIILSNAPTCGIPAWAQKNG